MKLTRETIGGLSLPEGKSECEFYDDTITGFGVRLRVGGSRKFIFRYRTRGGVTRRMTLGPAALRTQNRWQARDSSQQNVDPAMQKGLRLKMTATRNLDHVASIWNGILAAAGKAPPMPLDAEDVANLIEGLEIAQRYG